MPKILFIHQNFPAQFVHLAARLAQDGCDLKALCISGRDVAGVEVRRYALNPGEMQRSEWDLLKDFETKLIRAEFCFRAMKHLSEEGWSPDLIIAHPGWGEALFCKDVWPQAKLLIFAEFFYSAEGADAGFDAEFSEMTLESRKKTRLKNSVHLHAFQVADQIYSPTQWQKSQLPPEYQDKCTVIFDGIQTDRVRPNPLAEVRLKRDGITLAKSDPVVTFVNRNLEPYRGFHIFMRALPEILARHPDARCLIVGGDGVSYGSMPPDGGTWKEKMLLELRGQLPMDRIHFLGKLSYDDYLRVLQISACHVYWTYPFVLSWSCLEAMSAGCPVVASNTAPVREVIEHQKSGLLVDFFDVKALAATVCNVLDKPEMGESLGACARNSVIQKYDLNACSLPRLTSLVKQLL